MTHRDSSFGDGIDMQRAMGMAIDMGLAAEEEGEEMVSLTDDQMVGQVSGYHSSADILARAYRYRWVSRRPPLIHIRT